MQRFMVTFLTGERCVGRITLFADTLGAAFARLTTNPERGMGEWDHIDITKHEVDPVAMEQAAARLIAMQRPLTAEEEAYGRELAERVAALFPDTHVPIETDNPVGQVDDTEMTLSAPDHLLR